MDPELKKTYQELLELTDYLQLPESEWPLEEISREEAKVRLANFLGLDPKDPQFLEKAREEINKILAGELEIESVPRNLDELVEEYEEHLEELKREREKLLKRTYPTLDEQARNALQIKYANDLLEQLKESEKQLPEKERILTQNPQRAKKVSQQLADLFAPNLPQTARLEALVEAEYRKVLEKAQPKIKQTLERAGVPQSERVTQVFIAQAAKRDLPLAQEVAATPRSYIRKAPAPRKKISPEDLVLPKEVADRLAAEPEGVAFLPVYTVLQPQAAIALTQKAIFAPLMIVFKAAASEVTSEWQEMIEKGIFAEDIEATIKKYKEAGLPADHPIIQSLEDKRARFLEQQKRKIVRDGKAFYRDRLATRILRRYYLYAKRTGRLEAIDKETGLPLQTSPAPQWSKRKGYSWQLRRFLNVTGSGTRLYEPVQIIPGRSVIRLTLPSKVVKKITFGRFESFGAIITTIYKKTLGRAVNYVGKKLAKTAIGKAVKAGLKKAATWVATKLGVQATVTAAGAAAAPETAGVSLLVAAAINLAIETGGKILGKVWDQIKLTLKEPERFLPALGIAVIIAIVIPAPFGLIVAAPFAIAGSLGAISWGAASAGAVAGGFAANVVAFFTAVATLPITAPIALFVVGIISTIAAITFFIVMTTAGAFILPVGPTEMVEKVPPPPAPPDIPPPPGLTFRWPVDSPYTCSSNYGYRELTISGIKKCDYHEGIDIPASAEASVYSTAEGEVTSLGYHSGYGTYVVVKHNGLYSFYAHLQATATYVGEKVDQSSVIGYVDNTGYSTGTHLHFGFSSCGSVPSCFNNGDLTPDPCNYVSCSSGCEYRDRATGCPGLWKK